MHFNLDDLGKLQNRRFGQNCLHTLHLDVCEMVTVVELIANTVYYPAVPYQLQQG